MNKLIDIILSLEEFDKKQQIAEMISSQGMNGRIVEMILSELGVGMDSFLQKTLTK